MKTRTCTNCSRTAGPDDRFCGGCGTSLAANCVHCGRKLTADAAFCTGCGAAVGEAANTPSHEDRRQVTVMFIDMANFSPFASHSDPEQVRILQQEYFATVRDVVRRYGGVLEKYIGDAVLAIFGAPVATENDVLRAVRAGIETQRVLSKGRIAHIAAFRVGVATGEALVDLTAARDGGQAIVSGEVVNTAFRLQSIAPHGGVLVDETSATSTTGEIEYAEQAPQSIKGSDEPKRVFLAMNVTAQRRDRDESTPMVNRDHERGLLYTALHRAIRDRRPQLVTVFGSAGIGKSRLLRELSRHAARIPDVTVNWRVGHCPPFGENVTYAALAEIVKAQIGILDTDDEPTTRDRLDSALRTMPGVQQTEAARLADALGPLVGLPRAGLTPGETEAAWRRFLVAISAAGPTVLVFEDMHWADDDMLRFVELLGTLGTGIPMLVVATARPELRERRPDWTSAVTGAVSVSLGPMHDEHIATMYGLMFGQAVFPAGSVAPLVELAGGNPLYAHEFVRMLMERGELIPATFAAAVHQMPQTVQAVIANRLDLLDNADRAVLQAAAVIGMQFWPGALAATLGSSVETVMNGLYRLQQRDLVIEHTNSAMAGEPEYAFRHVLVRDVCYQRLPRAERVTRHQLAADWLERVSEHRMSDLSEVLANHRWAAHEIARTLGIDSAPYAPSARTALHRAARRAYTLHALDTAATLVDRALTLRLDSDPILELFAAELALYRDGDTFLDGGGMERLVELLSRLQLTGEASSVARALMLLGTAAWRRADRASTLSYLDQAVACYQELPETAESAEAMLELARVRMLDFETQPAMEAADAAAGIADRLGLSEVHAAARITAGVARYHAGEPASFSEVEAVAAYCVEHRLSSRRRALQNLGWACLEEGDRIRYDEVVAQMRGSDVASGHSLATSFHEEATQAYITGDWVKQTAAVSVTMRRPTAEWDMHSVMTTCWIRVLRGQEPDNEAMDQILISARRSGFHRTLRAAVAQAALCRALQGEHEEAYALLSELDTDWRARVMHPYGEWVHAVGHTAAALGPKAADQVRAMLELSPRRTPWVEAALACATGDFVTAADIYGKVGSASDRALSLSWGARAGVLTQDELAELRDFAARNGAPRLLG